MSASAKKSRAKKILIRRGNMVQYCLAWWETDTQAHLPPQTSRPKISKLQEWSGWRLWPKWCFGLGLSECLQRNSFWIRWPIKELQRFPCIHHIGFYWIRCPITIEFKLLGQPTTVLLKAKGIHITIVNALLLKLPDSATIQNSEFISSFEPRPHNI